MKAARIARLKTVRDAQLDRAARELAACRRGCADAEAAVQRAESEIARLAAQDLERRSKLLAEETDPHGLQSYFGLETAAKALRGAAEFDLESARKRRREAERKQDAAAKHLRECQAAANKMSELHWRLFIAEQARAAEATEEDP